MRLHWQVSLPPLNKIMMKKLLAACLVCSAAFSAAAAESSVVYTYANDNYAYWGKGKAEIYDIAIRIDDPALAGKKITNIRAVLNASEGIENTSLWLSKELTLEKIDGVKVTVPDTYSAEAAVKEVNFEGSNDTYGELNVALDTPYVLTEDGIYVGYSLTVPSPAAGSSLTNQQAYPIMLSPCNNPNSLFVRASKDFLKWMPYNDKLGYAATIYVTLEGEFPEYSVTLKNLSSTLAKEGENFEMNATIANIGAQDVTSLGYTYTVGGKSFDKTLEFANPIVPNMVSSVDVKFPIDGISGIDAYDLALTINKVNGQANDNIANSATAQVSVVPFVPVHRPLVEEFTGTWCGWCTRGYIAMELLNEDFGDDVVLAAYHNGDPMEVTAAFPVSVSGFPSASLNRNGVEDPYYGNANDGFGMKKEVQACIDSPVIADLSVVATWADADKTEIAVTTTSKFLENKKNAGYKLGYLLINNGLSGEGGDWNQGNYYSSYAGQYDGTDLEVLTTWPSSIQGLVFNDVVVDVKAMMGVQGSLPEDVEFNTPYTSEYSFNIASNKVIQNKDKLVVEAFIINPNGTIMNAGKALVGGGEAVKGLDANVAEVGAEYFTLSGARVANPAAGIFVKVAKMSDGSIRTSKVVVR